MKITGKLFYFVFAFICVCFFSCKDDNADNLTKEQKENRSVNRWIFNEMNTYYLWNDHLPKKPDYYLNPNYFFESICYWYDKNTNPEGDRFSWIQENYEELMNMLSGVSSDEIGFEFALYYRDRQSADIIGEIQYVKKNTPAQYAGLKRGQFFSEINGITITESNYYDILMNLKGNFTITLHNDVYVKNNTLIFSTTEEKNISTVSNYADNPVFLDSVYTINNKNIGYLVYNFFADDPNDKSKQYDIELANIFSNFKQKNISDLIVDFRYNSGGSSDAAIYLASMLVKNRSTKNLYYKVEYNSLIMKDVADNPQLYGDDFLNTYFTDTITAQYTLPNIGNNLQNLIFLTGKNTASASEMVINGLKPYMTVTLLGDTTVGKNVGSITRYDKKNTNKNQWAIQPIIAKFYNSNDESDFTAGFIPDIPDEDNYSPKYDLGDLKEGLLSRAIEHITGVPAPAYLRSSGEKPQRAPLRSIDTSVSRKAWTNKVIMPENSLPKIEQ